jgi:hypothetical protein
MKKRKNIILFIVCLTVFLLLLPIAIKLAIGIHRYIVPEGSVEPRYVAKMYMKDNQKLEKIFGENYKYMYLDMSWETNENGENTSTVTFWVFNHGKYTIYLELHDKEWVVIHFE